MKKILFTFLAIVMIASSAFAANEWRAATGEDTILGTTVVSDIDSVTFQNYTDPLDRVLSGFTQGVNVVWSSTTEVIVTAGQVVCSNTAGTIRKMRSNTSNTTVTWADIDAGAEASSTTYYVYAVADADATTFTVLISTNSTTPTGGTYYKKLGSFYNDSSSNIDRTRVYTNAYGNAVNDSSGIPKITAIYDYGTSTSSFTAKDSNMKVAFGAGTDPFTITNLPFSTASSYSVSCTFKAAATQTQQLAITAQSAASFTCSDGLANGKSISWIAIGF